jgi:DNA polymerase-3 subunit gamma/tau
MSNLLSVFNLSALPVSENAAAPNGELKKKPDTSVNSTPVTNYATDDMTCSKG